MNGLEHLGMFGSCSGRTDILFLMLVISSHHVWSAPGVFTRTTFILTVKKIDR